MIRNLNYRNFRNMICDFLLKSLFQNDLNMIRDLNQFLQFVPMTDFQSKLET